MNNKRVLLTSRCNKRQWPPSPNESWTPRKEKRSTHRKKPHSPVRTEKRPEKSRVADGNWVVPPVRCSTGKTPNAQQGTQESYWTVHIEWVSEVLTMLKLRQILPAGRPRILTARQTLRHFTGSTSTSVFKLLLLFLLFFFFFLVILIFQQHP